MESAVKIFLPFFCQVTLGAGFPSATQFTCRMFSVSNSLPPLWAASVLSSLQINFYKNISKPSVNLRSSWARALMRLVITLGTIMILIS